MSARIHDISIALHPGVPEWPGDTPFTCGWPARISGGFSVNVSTISGSPHVGTHADAPLHVQDDWPAADELPLDAFIGSCTVVDVSRFSGDITLQDIDETFDTHPTQRLILKTGSSIAAGKFPDSWPTLTKTCAGELLDRGVRLFGVDCPSVDPRESKTLPVHNLIFAGNGCVLENLDLRDVSPGHYELIACPLKLLGADAAPVRALLREG